MKSLSQGEVQVSLVSAGTKLAPRATIYVPTLKLCGELEAGTALSEVRTDLEVDLGNCYFYSNSKVTLGYLSNRDRKFSRYFSRHIELIENITSDRFYNYVSTDTNPADLTTRLKMLVVVYWFKCPDFLWNQNFESRFVT